MWSEPGASSALLVAGLHRLEAVRSLGLAEIDCVFVDMDATERRLWEIAENLHRSELTVQERAEHIAEWVRLTEEKISARLAENPKPGRPGAIDAARRELGVSEGSARRAVKIASITPEAKEAAREAGIDDNQSALLAVAKAAPQAQVEAVRGLESSRRYVPYLFSCQIRTNIAS